LRFCIRACCHYALRRGSTLLASSLHIVRLRFFLYAGKLLPASRECVVAYICPRCPMRAWRAFLYAGKLLPASRECAAAYICPRCPMRAWRAFFVRRETAPGFEGMCRRLHVSPVPNARLARFFCCRGNCAKKRVGECHSPTRFFYTPGNCSRLRGNASSPTYVPAQKNLPIFSFFFLTINSCLAMNIRLYCYEVFVKIYPHPGE